MYNISDNSRQKEDSFMQNTTETGENNNPFSKELAWTVFHQNAESINEFTEKCKKGIIDSENEHELLIKLLDLIGKMTDNTIFCSTVLQAMEKSGSRK